MEMAHGKMAKLTSSSRAFSPRLFRRLNVAEVNRLADFKMGNINVNGFGQIPGKGADLDLEEHVFEDAAAGFHARSFTDSLDGNVDCDFFVFGHFVQIDMEGVATQC